ncbi:MAG: CYTH domain-containing protein [Bdellovibrionaceae bacterium]|nr:CYTH domain-containing protein [Bdellovibrionales bacterium]MCB9253842.1 CYTH domain-containing protein [Pseudobdellovibrionaceae bacterium]
MALEKELKYGLTESEYKKVLRSLRSHIASREEQDNYYIDNPRLRLRSKKIGLRVRITNKRHATVTLKQSFVPTGKTGPRALKVRKEWEYSLPLGAARAVLRDPQKVLRLNNHIPTILQQQLKKTHWEKLEVLGCLSNLRYTATPHPKFKVELDHYKLFSKNYYEIELESTRPKEADTWLRAWLHEKGIELHPRRTSKLRRFLLELKKGRAAEQKKRRRKKK